MSRKSTGLLEDFAIMAESKIIAPSSYDRMGEKGERGQAWFIDILCFEWT